MNKGGSSHIEFILSFILFVTAVSVALYTFSPLKHERTQDSSVEYAFNQIIKNTSTTVEVYSIKIKNVSDHGDTFGVNISAPLNYNVRVETYYGEEIPSKRDGDNIYFYIDENDFFILRLSEDIEPHSYPPISTPIINSEDYIIAFVDSKEIISRKKLLETNQTYYENYDLLKDVLGIPTNQEFGINVNLDQEIIRSEENVPFTTNVYSETKREEVINKNGGVTFADITIKVW